MKHMLLAALPLAALFIPVSATAQAYNCYLVCSPPRVYCVPAGQPLPPIYKICGPSSGTPDTQSLSASLQPAASAPPPACVAEQVFNEDTQTTEWQMACD
ncbi:MULTISPECIES: hypothetical protein [unclassified Lysobacter]|uniref:hypothetical protein n=1 Tax=unclassified Lysobacter TaxID=2635362 RepID=UPI001C20F95F|nr:hypothetical protein [Lysobacter sp. MMG2]MBU8977479.1 hypothetical protein [Lysobacter sp. MMG2]